MFFITEGEREREIERDSDRERYMRVTKFLYFQGKTPLSRQVAFLEALFDLLESYKMDSNSLNDSSLVPNMNW